MMERDQMRLDAVGWGGMEREVVGLRLGLGLGLGWCGAGAGCVEVVRRWGETELSGVCNGFRLGFVCAPVEWDGMAWHGRYGVVECNEVVVGWGGINGIGS